MILPSDIPPEAWPVDDVWLSANLARLKLIFIALGFLHCLFTSFANVDTLLDALFWSWKARIE